MPSKQNIIITIGSYGSVVSFHDKGVVKNKIFVEKLDDESKKQISAQIKKYKSYHVYILLDTVDQSYKKKIYPSVRKSDLNRLIKRDMLKEGDQSSLKSYILLNPDENKPTLKRKTADNRWDCLFVSASIKDSAMPWIELLDNLPNRLLGIYLMPVEAFNLFNLIKKDVKAKSTLTNKRNNLYCLVIETKVNGFRQIIFSETGISFTRVVSYDATQPDFAKKYDQDMHSTIEYLKRIYPDLTSDEIDIVNIFSPTALENLSKAKMNDLHIINYTPHEAANIAGFNNLVSKKSGFCDVLLAQTFSKAKKLLKFSLPQIDLAEKLYFTLKSSIFVIWGVIASILVGSLVILYTINSTNNKITQAEQQRAISITKLQEIKAKALEGTKLDSSEEEISIETISDFGKMEEILSTTEVDLIDIYLKMRFLKNFKVKLDGFDYTIEKFNRESPSKNPKYTIVINGEMKNESGDIEDLFTEFDSLVAEVKKEFNGAQINYSQLPRNIDFNKKYYNFPVNFSIKTK